jgi:hypothetical protein
VTKVIGKKEGRFINFGLPQLSGPPAISSTCAVCLQAFVRAANRMSNSAVVGGSVHGGFPMEVGRASRSGAQKECAMRGLFPNFTT